MTPDGPEAFLNLTLKPAPEGATLCPVCQGQGYRHEPYVDVMCGACWGYGYLQPGQTCPHEWQYDRTIGRCLHVWKCTKCGAEREVDSSD